MRGTIFVKPQARAAAALGGVVEARATLLAVALVAMAVCACASAGAAEGAHAAGVKPAISNLAAAPATVTSGGTTSVTASVTGASECTLSSRKPVAGLPATLDCEAGTVGWTLVMPANPHKRAVNYKLTITARGRGRKAKGKTTVVVLPAPARPAGFIGSIDTMKLSKDQAAGGFTTSDAQAVDLAAATAATHITVDTPIEDPAVLLAWTERVHKDGKHVWFRLATSNGGSLAHGDSASFKTPWDGYPGFGPGYLTTLHDVMLANRGLFKPGDVLDGDAEAENSSWWATTYGCGVQQACTPCPDLAHMTSANKPCSPVSEFNRFLTLMTEQENRDLKSIGVTPCATITSTSCVLTQVHSTDPGVGIHELSPETVEAMGNVITVDSYPDQNATSPETAVTSWKSELKKLENAWNAKGIAVSILVGEWGYSNTIDVTDAQQEAVIRAETTKAFQAIPYLIGTNYWVGPGNSSDGGFTNIFIQEGGQWRFRPAANDVSAFYAEMAGPPPPAANTLFVGQGSALSSAWG
jgi:hypothetical protein